MKEKLSLKDVPKDEIVFTDNKMELADDSDDSVYNSSNQDVD